MKRGRILQALSAASANNTRREEARREDQIGGSQGPEQIEVEKSKPTTARGRGGFIGRQIAAARQPDPIAQVESSPLKQPAAQVEPVQLQTDRDAGDENSSASRSISSDSRAGSRIGRLVRQDSSTSRSSALSQQFAAVEISDLKANLPKQPAQTGTAVQLGVNYMTFETDEAITIQEYHVDFMPNIESIRLRYSILRSEQAVAVIGPVIHWTGTNLYLPTKLPQRITSFTTVHPVTGQPVKVDLKYIKTPPEEELISFYNSLMHKLMTRLDYVIINRQHYSPLHKIKIEQFRMEVWPGWITAIQRLDGGIKLAVDATFKVLRLETVFDVMDQVRQRCRGINLKPALEQELVGSIIMTRYNNRSYRIDGIDTTKKPSDTFTLSDGKTTSYIDYMRQHWNTEVQNHHQPMIVSYPKPKRGQEPSTEAIYLIPELCVTTGLTEEMRKDFNIMKAIGDHTRLPPAVREGKLVEFLNQLATDSRARTTLGDWGLSVKTSLDVVTGRRLDTETILLGNQRKCKVNDDADWTRAATGGPVFKSVPIENWVLMCPERDWNSAEDLMSNLRDVTRSLGMQLAPPRIIKLPNDSVLTYVNAGKQNVRRTDQLVVILTPGKTQREDRYSACKRLFSCDMPVPCQFIRCGTISNPRRIRSIVQKVAIQVLSKVGGQPWAMKFPMKSFMIVGIDVYHDTNDRKRSCVGFVASMNEFTSTWWSQTFFQNSLEEIGQKIKSCMVTALTKYHAINGFVPQRIIVYRDGVGDGQMETVLEIEIAQVVSGLKYYMRDSSEPIPTLSYVVVQKRINAKFSLRQGNSIVNPLPGTFLDHTITQPQFCDFYLVSQHVNQGTVSPTKYVVLTETGPLKLEQHQKLAYKMTHMYYNWTGTIRVPAPCQYAHKLAYLTGQNIKQQASERLEDKLYYL